MARPGVLGRGSVAFTRSSRIPAVRRPATRPLLVLWRAEGLKVCVNQELHSLLESHRHELDGGSPEEAVGRWYSKSSLDCRSGEARAHPRS